MGIYYILQWGCRCSVDNDGQDARPGDTPKGASPSLGKPQRHLKYLFLLCFSLLSIFWKEIGGVLRLVVCFMVCLAV